MMLIKLSTKVYYYLKGKTLSKLTHGPGSIYLTPRSFRAYGRYTTDKTVVFPYVKEEEDRRQYGGCMSILSLQMMNLYITDVTLDDDLDARWKGTMKIIELHRCH